MLRRFGTAAVLLLGAAGAPAFAQETAPDGKTAEGVVEDVNYTERYMTFQKGDRFALGKGVAVDQLLLLKGKQVRVRYDMRDGTRIASGVTPLEPANMGLSMPSSDNEATAGVASPVRQHDRATAKEQP